MIPRGAGGCAARLGGVSWRIGEELLEQLEQGHKQGDPPRYRFRGHRSGPPFAVCGCSSDIIEEVKGLVKRRFGGSGLRSGFCVYLLHFPDRSHYTGYTGIGPIERLRRHLSGRGSGWVYRRAARKGAPMLGVVEFQVTRSAAQKAERYYKRHPLELRARCVFCSVSDRVGASLEASEGMFGQDQVRGLQREVCSAADA